MGKFRVINAILLLITPTLLLLTKGGFCMSSRNNDLELTLELNKTNFEINDEFILKIAIVNNTNKNVVILPWMGPHEYGWFEIYDSNSKKMDIDDKVKFALDRSVLSNYISLTPHGTHTIILKGTIVKERVNVLIRDSKVFDGIFINFSYSRILLAGTGDYYIEAKFTNSEFIKNEAKRRFNFNNNVWQGTINSNRVKFSISQ